MTDARYWRWWQDKLAGKKLVASEGTPYAGFYRWERKDSYGGKKYATPVAYWPGENGELNCRIADKDVTPEYGRDNWIYVCDTPVPEDWYREVAEDDKPEWRDGLPVNPTIGDNEPPEDVSFETLTERAEVLAGKALARIKGPPIADQAECDRVAKLAEELAGLAKLIDEARKAERKPHDEALKEIQLKWAPLVEMADSYKNLKYKLITPWLLKLKKEQEEAAAAAAAVGEPVPEEKRPQAKTRGRAMALKSTKFAEITDFDLCLNHFKGHEAVQQTVQDLANKAIRAGLEVPGAKLREEQKAV